MNLHFPIFLLAGGGEDRALDGHFHELHFVAVLGEWLGALAGGGAGGGGRRFANLLAD